jgi:hypothetical protein
MNENRLEQIVHHQRLQLLFGHSAWLDQRERNLELREYILKLQDMLDRAGINYMPLLPPTEHPEFPFTSEIPYVTHASQTSPQS